MRSRARGSRPDPAGGEKLASHVEGSASLPQEGAAKSASLRAGSLKQLVPETSNVWHLARVLFAKAKATCFDTLESLYLDAILPRVACKIQSNRDSMVQICSNLANQTSNRRKIEVCRSSTKS